MLMYYFVPINAEYILKNICSDLLINRSLAVDSHFIENKDTPVRGLSTILNANGYYIQYGVYNPLLKLEQKLAGFVLIKENLDINLQQLLVENNTLLFNTSEELVDYLKTLI